MSQAQSFKIDVSRFDISPLTSPVLILSKFSLVESLVHPAWSKEGGREVVLPNELQRLWRSTPLTLQGRANRRRLPLPSLTLFVSNIPPTTFPRANTSTPT